MKRLGWGVGFRAVGCFDRQQRLCLGLAVLSDPDALIGKKE